MIYLQREGLEDQPVRQQCATIIINILTVKYLHYFHRQGFENYFSNEPNEFLLKNDGKMFVYPYMRELPDIFIEFFKCILKVGYEIPRLEYVMSQSESIF